MYINEWHIEFDYTHKSTLQKSIYVYTLYSTYFNAIIIYFSLILVLGILYAQSCVGQVPSILWDLNNNIRDTETLKMIQPTLKN